MIGPPFETAFGKLGTRSAGPPASAFDEASSPPVSTFATPASSPEEDDDVEDPEQAAKHAAMAIDSETRATEKAKELMARRYGSHVSVAQGHDAAKWGASSRQCTRAPMSQRAWLAGGLSMIYRIEGTDGHARRGRRRRETEGRATLKPTLDRAQAPVVIARFFPEITEAESLAHFREIGEIAVELGKIAVVVDLSDAPLATLALKRSAAKGMRSLFESSGERIVAVAHVVRSHVTRVLLGALQVLAPPPFPSYTTSSLDDALRWSQRWMARARRPAESTSDGSDAAKPVLPDDAHVASGLVQTLVTAARSRRLDVDAVLAAAGLPANLLDDVDARVPYGSLMRVLDAFSEAADDPWFGLHVAEEHIDAASFGVVGFAARSSTTLGEAIERTARYARIMNENTEMSVTFDARGARIVDGPIPPFVWPRQYEDMAMASFVTLGRKWTGVPFRAASVGFRHAAPNDVSEYVRVFGCEPAFGCAESFVVVPAAALDRPLEHGDPQLARYFDRRLDDLAQRLARTPGPLADVHDTLADLLAKGPPTVSALAKALGASERTLQRRLASRGVTFSILLDGVRREVALAAVRTPAVTVQELAARCGFSDVKAFRRAFRRWTGESPRSYRMRDR